MPLLIAIPVRNEERRLGPGLARLAESLQAHHCADVLVVVSDNGSTDWTRQVALEAAAKLPFRVVYHRASEQGDKGLAIRSAWESAPEGFDVLAYCDADMATDPEALVRGYRLIAGGHADVVAGSRWHPESSVVGRSWKRSAISRGLSLCWRVGGASSGGVRRWRPSRFRGAPAGSGSAARSWCVSPARASASSRYPSAGPMTTPAGSASAGPRATTRRNGGGSLRARARAWAGFEAEG